MHLDGPQDISLVTKPSKEAQVLCVFYDVGQQKSRNFAILIIAVFKEILFTFLWSISPFGEAKVGIPYGMLNDLNPYFVFVIALAANILVFPMMMIFLDKINTPLLKWNWYKKSAIWIAKRAKKGSQGNFKKYGYFGLALFVMIPLPGTGVYVGSIATYLFKMERKKAFTANVVGITISSIIVWSVTFFGQGAF